MAVGSFSLVMAAGEKLSVVTVWMCFAKPASQVEIKSFMQFIGGKEKGEGAWLLCFALFMINLAPGFPRKVCEKSHRWYRNLGRKPCGPAVGGACVLRGLGSDSSSQAS